MAWTHGLESSKYLETHEEDAPPEPPVTHAKSATDVLAELMKGISLIVGVTLLMTVGTWAYLNRASLHAALTGQITPGYLLTGKTWREYKRGGKVGPFDTVLWPEAADDADLHDFYRRVELPESPRLPDMDFRAPTFDLHNN